MSLILYSKKRYGYLAKFVSKLTIQNNQPVNAHIVRYLAPSDIFLFKWTQIHC